MENILPTNDEENINLLSDDSVNNSLTSDNPILRTSPLLFMLNNAIARENTNSLLHETNPLYPYYKLIINLLDDYEKKSAICKELPKGTICPINKDEIMYGQYYYKCSQCIEGCFKLDIFKQLFYHDIENSNINVSNITCPICRKKIIFFPQLYINKEESKLKSFIKKIMMNLYLL